MHRHRPSSVALGLGIGLSAGAGGPVSDPSITAIDAAGWQVTTPTPPIDFTGKVAAITAPGYDAAGNVIAFPVQIPMRGRLRQPAPNDGLLTASTCYLTEAICASDIVLGSGITSNSTEAYPLCIANWASGDYAVVGNSVTVYLTAFHYHGVACVIGTADDGNGHTASAITATQIVLPGSDANKIVGYALTFDVSGFTDKRNFRIDARVYPKRGTAASILDSSVATTITGSATTRNFGPRFFRKDTALAASPIYAAVSTSGNDGTGVVSTDWSAAQAAPFATLDGARVALKNSTLSGKAANSDDGCVIRLLAGAHALNTFTLFTNGATSALIIEAAPGESPATVTLTSNATAPVPRCQWLRFRNLKLVRGGAGFFVGNLVNTTAGKVFTEGCGLDNGGQSTSMFGSHMVSISGGTATNGASGTALFQASSGAKYEMIRGVTFATPPTAVQYSLDCYNVIGCTGNGVLLTNSTNSADNATIAFNRLLKIIAIAFSFGIPSGGPSISGVAVVQNVFEWISATSNPAFRPSGDGETVSVSNFLSVYNTFAGMDAHGRENVLYDDATGTTRRTHKWILDAFNGKNSANTKVDRFVYYSQANADAPNRIGAWWHAFGVGARGNHHRYRNASSGAVSFGPEDFGVGSKAPVSNTPPGDDPKFVSFQGTTGTTASPVAGAGGGDYHVQAGSPYVGMVPAGARWLNFDLDGTARKNDGAGACGAYEYAA